MAAVPSREQYLARWAALHGGYDPAGSVMVASWLRLVYACARPFAAARVRPDVITVLGLLVSALAALAAGVGGSGGLWAAAVLVVLAGVLDNLDGAVAVLTDRATAWGYVLDSAVDRCSDALFLGALWLAGAPAGVCVAAGVLAGLQEYVRARATGAGLAEIGVVTVAERPTRVIVTAAFLAAAGVASGSAGRWAEWGAWVFLVLSAIGLVQLTVVVHRRLTARPAG